MLRETGRPPNGVHAVRLDTEGDDILIATYDPNKSAANRITIEPSQDGRNTRLLMRPSPETIEEH